jgi:hypothetical protein
MVGPGFGHKNFQELISNSIQLLGEHPRKASPSGSNAIRAPLKKGPDVRLIPQLRQRKVDEYYAIQSGRPSE